MIVVFFECEGLTAPGYSTDDHARHNTTSVYTAPMIFPMLPKKLSTDLTSLNFNEDRLSIFVEMVIDDDGSLQDSDIYPAQTAAP